MKIDNFIEGSLREEQQNQNLSEFEYDKIFSKIEREVVNNKDERIVNRVCQIKNRITKYFHFQELIQVAAFILVLILIPTLSGHYNKSKNSQDSDVKKGGLIDKVNNEEGNTKTQSNDFTKHKFAIYLVKGLSSFEATKKNIKELPLENEPIITEKEVSSFYWKSNIFKTDQSVYDKLKKVTKLSGTPFVVTANGERVYLGTLWTGLSSMFPPSETPVLFIESGALTIDKLNKDGYNISPKGNEYYFEIFAPSNGNDNRGDIRIYNSLKNVGIIKE